MLKIPKLRFPHCKDSAQLILVPWYFLRNKYVLQWSKWAVRRNHLLLISQVRIIFIICPNQCVYNHFEYWMTEIIFNVNCFKNVAKEQTFLKAACTLLAYTMNMFLRFLFIICMSIILYYTQKRCLSCLIFDLYIYELRCLRVKLYFISY